MTKDELAKYPRKTPAQLLAEVPDGLGRERSLEVVFESAMNLEWWRGYHAGKSEQAERGGMSGDDVRSQNG